MNSESLLLIIDSNDRDSILQNSNNFKYTLSGAGFREKFKYKVNKICIPYSFYSIPTQLIRLDDNGTPRDITIPAGNYIASEIENVFRNAITAAGGVGTNYNISYSPTTLKFTITRTSGTFSFDFLTTPGFSGSFSNYKNIGILMGLIIAGTTATTTGASFTGPYAANLSGITSIKVICPQLAVNYPVYDRKNKAAIIGTVDVNVDRGEYIVWQNTTDNWYTIDWGTFNYFNFTLVDNTGDLVDLNGKDWTIEIYIKK